MNFVLDLINNPKKKRAPERAPMKYILSLLS
jgi:hypothetical protein